MLKFVFIGTFLIALLAQGILWSYAKPLDDQMWANQALFFQTGDPQEFNASEAYGHPGGPIILATIGFHEVTGISYEQSLQFSLTLINALIIAGIVTVCSALRKNIFWCIALLAILPIHRLYALVSTPPSIVASLLVVFLCFYTMYIYENPATRNKLLLWGAIGGMLVATRFDIGGITVAVLGIFLATKYPLQKFILPILLAGISFIVWDPFMWFMPLQHVYDLFDKMLVHYAVRPVYHLPLLTIWDMSFLSIISVVFAAVCFVPKAELKLPVSKNWLYAIVIFTIVLYTVFLTSKYQAVRYFLPILLVWETLLPLFLYTLLQRIEFAFLKDLKKEKYMRWGIYAFIILLLASYHLLTLCY